MSLFGTTNQQQGSSLFGGNNNNQQQQQPGTSSLFGGQQQQQPQQQNTGTSLFGAQATQQQNQQQPHQPGQPLPYAPGQSGTFGAPITQPQPTNTNNPNNPNLPQNQNQNQNLAANALAATSGADLAASRLQANNLVSTRNEKSTFSQVQTLVRKWDPRSQETPLQSYLYNAVSSSYAPFYYRNVDEEEEGWEEALRKKPAPVKGEGGGEEVSFVPVLVRGFRALGERVEFQARTVNEMRARLHEMNNSLNAIIHKHQTSLTLRLSNTHRTHTALSQRTLRLAVKIQVLRSRGFALDAAEETLRKSLLALEKQTFDGAFVAREEEIWARMVQLRERGRWLEEEGRRLAAESEGAGASGGAGGGQNGVPEEVVVQTKRVLRDYDGQIAHLARELEEVRREFEEWEGRK